MNADEKFKLIIIGLCSFLFSMIFLWVVFLKGIIPMGSVTEFRSSSELPTFQSSMENSEILDNAWEAGLFQEDENVKKLRDKVLSTLEEYKSFPCNEKMKNRYVDAVEGFVENRMERMSSNRKPDDSSEVLDVNGRVVDSSLKFDSPIMDAIITSAADGLILEEDISKEMSILIRAGVDQAGGSVERIVCEEER